MNGLNLSDISNAYVGSTPVSAIYYGINQIYPSGLHFPTIDPTAYANEYFTIEARENVKVEFYFKSRNSSYTSYRRTIQYSFDKTTWHNYLASGENPITLNSGQKIYFKGDNATYSDVTHNSNGTITVNYWHGFIVKENPIVDDAQNLGGKFAVSGNIMSLINSDSTQWNSIGFNNATCVFFNLFGGVVNVYPSSYRPNLLDATRLYLPDATEKYCYESMFTNCISLTAAPLLRASLLNTGCYSNMFTNCTSLKYVKILAEEGYDFEDEEDLTISECIDNWLYNVSSTGIIKKKSSLSLTANSASGVPSGWTTENI